MDPGLGCVRPAGKWRALIVPGFDEHDAFAVWAIEGQIAVAEALAFFEAGHLGLREALPPVTEGVFRYRENGSRYFPGTRLALHDVGEGKVGHDRPGRAGLVAVIKVIDVRRVEVDRLLDSAQAK